jgi:hypothetical protein
MKNNFKIGDTFLANHPVYIKTEDSIVKKSDWETKLTIDQIWKNKKTATAHILIESKKNSGIQNRDLMRDSGLLHLDFEKNKGFMIEHSNHQKNGKQSSRSEEIHPHGELLGELQLLIKDLQEEIATMRSEGSGNSVFGTRQPSYINIDKSEVEITKKGNLKIIFYSQKKNNLAFYKALFKRQK